MIQLGENNMRYMSRRDDFSGSKQERRVSGGGGKNLYHEGKKQKRVESLQGNWT